MSSVLGTYARKPISFIQGKGSYLYTENGEQYLDFVQGIGTNIFGHANEHLIKVLYNQSKKLWHISNAFIILGTLAIACCSSFLLYGQGTSSLPTLIIGPSK